MVCMMGIHSLCLDFALSLHWSLAVLKVFLIIHKVFTIFSLNVGLPTIDLLTNKCQLFFYPLKFSSSIVKHSLHYTNKKMAFSCIGIML